MIRRSDFLRNFASSKGNKNIFNKEDIFNRESKK
jgi:hypothetical protein